MTTIGSPMPESFNLTTSQLCSLAGWDVQKFQSMNRRDQLPFDSETFAESSRGWRRYSPFEALLMLLTSDLSNRDGLSLDRAARIVQNSEDAVRYYLTGMSEGCEDFWIGFVWLGHSDSTDGGFHVSGKLVEIAQRIARGERHNADIYKPYENLTRIAAANVTNAVKVLKRRATQLDVIIPAAFWQSQGAKILAVE